MCTSGDPQDLETTDRLALEVLKGIVEGGVPKEIEQQYNDNIKWITEASKHKMVVGSQVFLLILLVNFPMIYFTQARILYSDAHGRAALAKRFNEAVGRGELKASVVISRDHHDVSGTDSPFRETSNIYDGSAFTADMAVQNCIGDSFRYTDNHY